MVYIFLLIGLFVCLVYCLFDWFFFLGGGGGGDACTV